MTNRKICVVTGSRAEYGLLYWLIHDILNGKDLDLQLVVTGMHLSREYGYTVQQIEADGFAISHKVEMLVSSDTPTGITKSIGLGMISFADVYASLRPDLVVMLGDRFEILAAASAALIATLPICHLHGGELTEGAFDDAIRHSITKMSHLHCVSTEIYRQRVIQLGEDPSRVFNVGAVGLDNLERLCLLDRSSLEAEIDFSLGERSLLVNWHPVTLERAQSELILRSMLDVLNEFTDVKVIFTKANADTGGGAINQMIDQYVATHRDRSISEISFGQLRYLSLLKHVTGVVGNSSSGIIEAPSLQTGTVNIGDRQKGRVRASSVIDCSNNKDDIRTAIERLFSKGFQSELSRVVNPHGGTGVSKKIIDIIRKSSLAGIQQKSFYDVIDN